MLNKPIITAATTTVVSLNVAAESPAQDALHEPGNVGPKTCETAAPRHYSSAVETIKTPIAT